MTQQDQDDQFFYDDTLVGPAPSKPPENQTRWQSYLPDAEPTEMAGEIDTLAPFGEDATVEETTGLADIRRIVREYPDVPPERLTPFGRAEPEPRGSFPMGGAAILTPLAPARRRSGSLAIGVTVAFGAFLSAGVVSLLLALS